MKKINKAEEIHVIEKNEPTEDIEELRKKLLSNEIHDYEVISLGNNRGQFFIRLPTRMTNRLQLKKEDKIKISLTGSEENMKILLEVVKHES